MLCFDSCVIRDIGSRSETQFTLLRALAVHTGHPLCLPQTVLDELMGNYERNVREACDTVTGILKRREEDRVRETDAVKGEQASRVLLALVPRWYRRSDFARGTLDNLPLWKSAVADEHRRLRGLFKVLPKPEGADAEGNRREIKRIRPAVQDGKSGSKGSRDSAIWVTVLAAARDLNPGMAFFVSSDNGFTTSGERRPLHPDLRYEADTSSAGNLCFYSDVDQLVDRLSSETTPPDPIEKLVAHEHVEASVRNFLRQGDFRIQLSELSADLGHALELGDELFPQPRNAVGKDAVRAARLGEITLVAFNRIWHVKRRYRPWIDGAYATIEAVAEFSVKMGVLVTYVDGQLESVSISHCDGVIGQAGL